MKRLVQFSVCAILGFSSIHSAYAQELDANGQELKAMFEEMINNKANTALADVNFEGDISVEQSGDYYAVTLPYATIDYFDGAKFEIGLIAINAAAHDTPGQWKMTFAVPTPMNFIDPKSGESFQINIGGQRSSGIWDKNLGYFSKLDANYQNVTMSDAENSFTFNMPEVRAVYDLDTDENGKWSGPVYFTFNDVNLNMPEEGGEVMRIGGLNLNMEMFKYDPSVLPDYQAKVENLVMADENAEPDSAMVMDIFSSLLTLLGDGFTSEYQLSDITIRDPKNKENYESIKIDKANFGFDMTGFLQNNVAFNLRLGFDGFDMQPLPENFPAIAPKNFNLDLAIENIPFNEISEMSKQTAQMAIDNPQMAQMAGMSVLFKLPALLSQAETSLVINNNYLGNDEYHVDLDGKVVTDLQAVNSATADITGKIRNLDTLLNMMNEYVRNNPDDQQSKQILMGLTMAKGLAEISTDENGNPLHIFKFIMTPKGQMLINGNDMSIMMGGGPNAAPPPAQQIPQ
jgi:hypothetical protein